MTPPPTGISAALTQYLHDARELITARVVELADTAVRHRPPWMQPLGQPPTDPDLNRQWQARIATIAAYREQFKVTTDDPAHILGPHAEPGTPARKPYWDAAESILAARRLAGVEAPSSAVGPNMQARAQAATDIYRALPQDERAKISTEMAGKLGPLWFGDLVVPDEDAASQPIHAATLARTLTQHGYLTADGPHAAESTAPGDPVEARAVRRVPTRNGHRSDSCVPAPVGPAASPLRVPRPYDPAARQGPQPRLT